MFQVTKDVYSVGVLNPNMRIFDIVMKTEYGTSYNSYIVKSDKIALIDACHEQFYNEYVKNIEEILPLNKIDYLIINHCEPDHTGVLRKLLPLLPNVEIYASPSASIFLKEIINLPLTIHTIKDHETLNLGNKTLEFIIAPFLHWPDSMFTYIKESKTVFTCDFLGSHYCEPSMTDQSITYIDAYKKSVKLYYDAIFSPFKGYVTAGLDKLSKLNCEYICTSHGPILSKHGLYEYVSSEYRKWSIINSEQISIPIFYASSYGYTAKIARAIEAGIKSVSANIKTHAYDLNSTDNLVVTNAIDNCTALCIGSPTLNKNAVPPILHLLSDVDAINAQGKQILIFGSYGWSGEAHDILINAASSLKLLPYDKGIHLRFNPTDEQLSEAKKIAHEFALNVTNK